MCSLCEIGLRVDGDYFVILGLFGFLGIPIPDDDEGYEQWQIDFLDALDEKYTAEYYAS